MLEFNVIKYLNDFIVLAECRNYYKAAEQLYLSRSALNKHIKDLETAVGHKLFSPSGHKLELTDFGRFFIVYARRFLELNNEYENAKNKFEQNESSEVRIAISAFMNCDHIVNMLWEQFAKDYPQYHLSTGEHQTDAFSPDDLFAMGYELVFALSREPGNKKYNCYTWSESTIIALLPLSHPLTQHSSIKLSELSSESFILFPKSSSLHQYIVAFCQEAGFNPKVNFTIHGNANLIELVSSTLGVSMTTYNNIRSSMVKGRVAIVPLDPPPLIYLNLYYRKDLPLSSAAKTFFEYATSLHKNLE